MRALRPSLLGAVIICQLSCPAVVAQAQGEAWTSLTLVTGMVTQAWGFSEGTGYPGAKETFEDVTSAS
jgi:hypothetical protein